MFDGCGCSHSSFRHSFVVPLLEHDARSLRAQPLPQFSAWIVVFWAVPLGIGRADEVTLMVAGSPCGRLTCGTRHDGGFSDNTARCLVRSLYRFCSPLVWGTRFPSLSVGIVLLLRVRYTCLGPVRFSKIEADLLACPTRCWTRRVISRRSCPFG